MDMNSEISELQRKQLAYELERQERLRRLRVQVDSAKSVMMEAVTVLRRLTKDLENELEQSEHDKDGPHHG